MGAFDKCRVEYSQLLLFTVLTFYKIARNTESANTEPLPLGFLQASGHIFINRSIPNLVSCVSPVERVFIC